MTTPKGDARPSAHGAGPARRAGAGRDAVLALGLLGTGIAGLAAFVRAAGADGIRIPIAPVAAAAVLVLGVLLAKWGCAPVRRRSRTTPPARYAAAPADPPEVGADAFDHAGVDADGFEHAVAALCVRDGCTSVEVVGGAGDLGADVLATTADGRRVVLQCKHYAEDNRVGSQDLQRFGGTCYAVHEADVAVVVTTSSFTAPAAEYADTCGIARVDGEALAAWTEQRAPAPWESAGGAPATAPSDPTGGAGP
ncbi:restriction endonuclease [Streptomyces katrae]|uniref:Restriction endonuclease n=1 Tax=Streptomyces katrae TaxID=68223 RepID=A0ABT7H1B4_9ACTN|nr:restriction endonuclease [Streptomyces katrae]MDK9499682.1 restriction endonuclease [Streptomyces katrae]